MGFKKTLSKGVFSKGLLMILALSLGACGQGFKLDPGAGDFSSLSTRQVVAPHIKYFGFYASAMDGLEDVSQKIAGFSNISWIASASGQELARIENAKKHNLKAVIDVQKVFFDEEFNLLPDHQDRWNAFAPTMKPYVDDGTIVAFYPIDEPFNKKRSAGQNKQERVLTLERIGGVIKTTFPNVPIALILGGDQWDGYIVPHNFDWIGFDVYDCWENCGGHSVPEIYGKLKTKLRNPNQRIILVPDTWKWSLGDPDEVEELKMIQLFNKYVELANAQSRVIGMINFIYQDLPQRNSAGAPTGKLFPGLNRLGYLRKRVAAVGAQYKKANELIPQQAPNPVVPTPIVNPAPVASAPVVPVPVVNPPSAPVAPAPVANPTPPSATAQSGLLQFSGNGLVLNPNQSIETGSLLFIMQADGNLVLYRKSDSYALWASNTVARCQVKPCHVVFQGDGNLVIYQADGKPLAASHTVGASRFELSDQAPHLRIYSGSQNVMVWSRP
ncbi:MAG: hypothetical protein RJB66_2563 [Pseudomonadota bacterium]|jgi:hypothetical protein